MLHIFNARKAPGHYRRLRTSQNQTRGFCRDFLCLKAQRHRLFVHTCASGSGGAIAMQTANRETEKPKGATDAHFAKTCSRVSLRVSKLRLPTYSLQPPPPPPPPPLLSSPRSPPRGASREGDGLRCLRGGLRERCLPPSDMLMFLEVSGLSKCRTCV